MNQSLIRWRKEDSIKLQRAINTFNRNVRKLRKTEENLDYLPDIVSYNKLRKNIISRKEFNRVITSLRNFSKKGSGEIYELPSGQKITKWEYQEMIKSRGIAIRSLRKELVPLEEATKLNIMGNARLQEIKSTINNLNKLEETKGVDLELVKKRIKMYGEESYELRKAIQYRKNYMFSLSQMSSYDNYDKFVDRLEKIKNPIKFFEFISQSNILKDIFNYYPDKNDAQTYGGFTSNQEAFNRGLEEVGII